MSKFLSAQTSYINNPINHLQNLKKIKKQIKFSRQKKEKNKNLS